MIGSSIYATRLATACGTPWKASTSSAKIIPATSGWGLTTPALSVSRCRKATEVPISTVSSEIFESLPIILAHGGISATTCVSARRRSVELTGLSHRSFIHQPAPGSGETADSTFIATSRMTRVAWLTGTGSSWSIRTYSPYYRTGGENWSIIHTSSHMQTRGTWGSPQGLDLFLPSPGVPIFLGLRGPNRDSGGSRIAGTMVGKKEGALMLIGSIAIPLSSPIQGAPTVQYRHDRGGFLVPLWQI